MNKQLLSLSAAVALLGTIGLGSAYAATTIGTVTGEDGDVKDLLQIDAEVTNVDGTEVSFVDTETGTEYTAGFGPSWYSEEYSAGDSLVVEGVETTADNEHGHDFQAMKVNDTVLREEFEGKPAWAGTRGGGNGTGEGAGLGSGNQSGYRGQGQGGNGSGSGDCDLD